MAYDRRGEHHQKSLQRNLDVLKGRLAEIEANPLPHPKPKGIKGLRFHSDAPCFSQWRSSWIKSAKDLVKNAVFWF